MAVSGRFKEEKNKEWRINLFGCLVVVGILGVVCWGRMFKGV